jgi:hypothetical protein
MKFNKIISKITLIAIYFVTTIVSINTKANEKEISTNDLWKNYLQKQKIVFGSFETLSINRKEAIKSLESIFELTNSKSPLEKQLSNSKVDEAEKSIAKKKLEDIRKNEHDAIESFFDKFSYSGYEAWDRIGTLLEKNKKADVKKVIANTVDEVIEQKTFRSSRSLELFNAKCSKDQKFDESCLKNWISSCANLYTSKDKKLGIEFVDEKFGLQKEYFNAPNKLFEYFVEGDKGTTFHDGYAGKINACWYISSLGYNFDQTDLDFKKNSLPDWVDELTYDERIGVDYFESTCPSKPNEIKHNIKTLEKEKRSTSISKDLLDHVKKGISACEKWTDKVCTYVSKVGQNDVAFNYVTAGCEKRQVTLTDIEKDIEKFKEYGETDAAIKQHESISEFLKICKVANDKEFTWKVTELKFDKEKCKSGK